MGGGWGVMTSDACGKHGIKLANLSNTAFQRINELLPPFWSKGNPIDTVAALDLSIVGKIMKIIFEEMGNEIDGILLLGVGGFSFLAEMAQESPLIPEKGKKGLGMITQAEIKLFSKIKEYFSRYFHSVDIRAVICHTAECHIIVILLVSHQYSFALSYIYFTASATLSSISS